MSQRAELLEEEDAEESCDGQGFPNNFELILYPCNQVLSAGNKYVCTKKWKYLKLMVRSRSVGSYRNVVGQVHKQSSMRNERRRTACVIRFAD